MIKGNKLYSFITWSRIICMSAQLILCILRWTSVINWSWGLVLIPLYIFLVVFIIGFIIVYVDARRQDKMTQSS